MKETAITIFSLFKGRISNFMDEMVIHSFVFENKKDYDKVYKMKDHILTPLCKYARIPRKEINACPSCLDEEIIIMIVCLEPFMRDYTILSKNLLNDQLVNKIVPMNVESFSGCFVCGNKTNLKKCAGCKVASYCSIVCQRKAWITHKQECKALQKTL